ncbi:MAG: VacB/RNase II family 3'-5' exoribonuclease [Phycisphaerales bacterium]|nr:VacB/RNase II family 3'-5' exoribonuclease [Phycisphaerales bacterium]
MPLRFKSRVLAHLRDHRYEPVGFDLLAEQVGVEQADLPEFEQALDELMAAGQITSAPAGEFMLPPIGRELIGKIRVNPKGFGFIIPDAPNREGDLFVPPGATGTAVSGDRVRARVVRSRGRGGAPPGASPYTGEVVEILQRAKSSYVGTLRRFQQHWLVEPDDRQLHDMVRVRDVGAKNAREGDKVVVEMIRYPNAGEWGEGVIIKRLGEAGLPDVETQAVIHTYSLPGAFPEAALDQAAEMAREFADTEQFIEGREDLREQFIITIDPPDARDFDDAISIQRLDDGGWELGVHIADASTFVTLDSPLDLEARQRANSVYLPRHVIPMLPEVLSNGVCSLQEGVDRLTKSVFIRYDGKGQVRDERYCKSVIRSSKRLTYLEAEHLILGNAQEARKHSMSETDYPEALLPTLKLMDELAKVLRRRRTRDGMIVLTLPEVELIFDDQGHVIGAEPEDDASTHGLIEMFMVEANEALARLFDRLNVPILRRTHPDPSTFDLGELRQYFRVAGLNLPKSPTRFELQHVLEATRGTPRQQAVHLAILKSLTKAEYSPAMIGHFALASAHYAHFTSPIRRYPDLVLHRQLAAYLEQTRNGSERPRGKGYRRIGNTLRKDKRCPDEARLIEIGTRCNEAERNAEMAERSLRNFLVLQFIAERHQGDVMDGVVVGVSESAVFVQLDQCLVEGFVNIRDPEAFETTNSGGKRSRGDRQGRWRINQQTGALTSESGATIQIGDRLQVRIMLVDPPARRMDLRIVAKAAAPAKSRESNRNQKGQQDTKKPRRENGKAKPPGRSKPAPKKPIQKKKGKRTKKRR